MAKKKSKAPTTAAPVEAYKHDKKRARIPTQEESVKLTAKQKQPVKKKYDYDPSLDPQLIWSGKKEQGAELAVPTVPIYVQEKIAPETIIARLKIGTEQDAQMLLFGDTSEMRIAKTVEFYEHEDSWQNRMILGDSLLVMNSLLEKEKMRGKVQCIYIDPPYGIKFSSNWQVSTRKRDVKDKLEDFVRQPEQVKAFRDTWELGNHSYLSYLRERLLLSRELLTESGSCFVQISDENLHWVRCVLDEVFGSDNFVRLISFKTTSGFKTNYLTRTSDYLIWYAKDISNLKYRQLYLEKNIGNDNISVYKFLKLPDGSIRKLKDEELLNPSVIPNDCEIFRLDNITSQGSSSFDVEFNGKVYKLKSGLTWKTHEVGMKTLINKNRIAVSGKGLSYVRYLNDFPINRLPEVWTDTITGSFTEDKQYVVQTNTKVIQRCILMTTDPCDIILDPTCGSGTTAFVAEQWGRRWITTDTSRVALAIARTRLMTAKYLYYKLKDENSLSMGFEYKTVPHVTLKSLANDEPPEDEILYDQPAEVKDVIRVTGPFTVESLSPHRVSDAQEMLSSERFVQIVISNMLSAGIQTGEKGARVQFENLDILAGGPEVQAIGEYKTKDGLKKAAVSIGPEFGSVDDDFIRDASKVAKKFASLLIIAATSFEASAFSEPDSVNGLQIMKVKINPDLSMGDLLKKTGSGNLFLAFGRPQFEVKKKKDTYTVEIKGVDIYDPVNSEIRSSGSGDPDHDIAAWFIDTNYNGEAFFVTHAYFLGGNKPYEKLKKALKADIDESLWDELYSTVSRPFPKPLTGKIAVKVINHFGDEVMKVEEIK
ncbi:MAG: site-specific DNA-methyltransferase [Ignavibacteria bacterium]|nr:site-specific DNA-methyltransferase [Ignavibacteria bacterium]